MIGSQVRKVSVNNKEVVVIDFSNLKEDQMMELISTSRALIIREQQKRNVMALFNEKNFLTPKFMRHFETDQREVIAFIDKQAVVGLTTPQKMIVKGYNTFQNRDIKSFATEEEALIFLSSEEENS